MSSTNSTPAAVRPTNFIDLLPECDRCRTRPAVVRFKRAQVCVFCFTELDRRQPFMKPPAPSAVRSSPSSIATACAPVTTAGIMFMDHHPAHPMVKRDEGDPISQRPEAEQPPVTKKPPAKETAKVKARRKKA